MGMFDDVDAPAITCRCGATVAGWQSKSGPCELRTIPAADVDEYYSICPGCQAFHLFQRVIPPEQPFNHFVDGSPA